MSSFPPDGFTVRCAALEDADAVADLILAVEPVEPITGADVRDWWRGQDIERDIRLVYAPDGRLAGSGDVSERADAASVENYVHPDFHGRGLGAYLVDWGEERSRELGFATVRNAVLSTDAPARALLTGRGYRPVRHYYVMKTEVGDDLPSPDWPTGVDVRTFAAGDERALYEADREAFAEDWGRPERSFEVWWSKVGGAEKFDPGLTCPRLGRGKARRLLDLRSRLRRRAREPARRAAPVAGTRSRDGAASPFLPRAPRPRRATGEPRRRRVEPDRRDAAVRARRHARPLPVGDCLREGARA